MGGGEGGGGGGERVLASSVLGRVRVVPGGGKTFNGEDDNENPPRGMMGFK